MLQDRKPRFQDASNLMSAADYTEKDAEPALGAARVGAELRAARLRLGWKLADVAANLRIRLPYLEAIEDGRIADLPGNAYAVGFIRAYATVLGLDAAEVARRFRAEADEVNRKPVLSFPAPVPERGVPAGAVVLLGVLIAAGSYAAWYKLSGDRSPPVATIPAVPERLAPLADRAAPPSNPSPQVASVLPPPGSAIMAPLAPPRPSPAALAANSSPSTGAAPTAGAIQPSAPAGAAAAPAAPVGAPPAASAPADVPPAPPPARMVLRVKGDAWVQVKDAQGPILLSRVLREGETWPVPTGAKLLLTTGNAGGTEIVTDGVPGPSLGAVGTVRRNVPLDPDALKPLSSTARPKPQ